MCRNVLFLESQDFYSRLIDVQAKENLKFTFDGGTVRSDIELAKYDLIVYTIYSSFWFNFIIIKCKKLGIPTLLLFDGVTEFSNFKNNSYINSLGLVNYHPIVSDYLGVVGDTAKKYFDIRGCNTIKYTPYHMSTGDFMTIPKVNKLLITTANTAYYNDYEYNILLKMLVKVRDLLISRDIDFSFRIFDELLISDLGIDDNNNIIDGDFELILRQFSGVITTPSSISLTAMSHNLPVAHLQYRDYPHFFQSGWSIIPGIDPSPTITSMLQFDEDRMAFQASEVKSNFDTISFSSAIQNLEFREYEFSNKDDFFKNVCFKLLESKLNVNFEYTFRKLYWRAKKSILRNFIKKCRGIFFNK